MSTPPADLLSPIHAMPLAADVYPLAADGNIPDAAIDDYSSADGYPLAARRLLLLSCTPTEPRALE